MDANQTSSHRPSGKGSKGRGGSRLGLKTASSPAPSSPPLPPPTTTSLSAPPPAVPPPAAPTSSPTVQSSTVPPMPPQGAVWGNMPSNFALQHGNHHAPNSWLYPPGGFVNLVQQPQYPPSPQLQGENFHLGGHSMSYDPISPPPPSGYGAATPQPVKQGASTREKVNIVIDAEDNSEANRPVAKKRYWSHEEEERLASAWLNASKDPIKGNDKKGDTFWNEVTNVFNKKGNGKPIREINQLKIHWSRLKASITEFNGFWSTVTKMNTSGYSDEMHEAEAQLLWTNKYGKPFALVHWWKKLKDEPKWCAQFQKTEKNSSNIDDVPPEQLRPMGREAAKAERNGKRKKENIMEGIIILGDNIDKIVKVQEDRKSEREKVTEAQIKISDTNLKAAQVQKEAKMLEVYNSLLNQDTTHMSETQKASRDKAISKIEQKLFGD